MLTEKFFGKPKMVLFRIPLLEVLFLRVYHKPYTNTRTLQANKTGKKNIHTSYVCIQMSWIPAGGRMCPTSTKNGNSNTQIAQLASLSNICKDII